MPSKKTEPIRRKKVDSGHKK
uniref:Uncharacterized protein n=1 Tax=Anguilla anguilla TaxID=7936 RepID=A0A0E9Q2E3_ANGAN